MAIIFIREAVQINLSDIYCHALQVHSEGKKHILASAFHILGGEYTLRIENNTQICRQTKQRCEGMWEQELNNPDDLKN